MASVGKGTYTWSNGNKYVGEWKGWLQHGQGTLTWYNGYRLKGEWKDHKEWNGTIYDKKGNIYSKYVNGKEIKQ